MSHTTQRSPSMPLLHPCLCLHARHVHNKLVVSLWVTLSTTIHIILPCKDHRKMLLLFTDAMQIFNCRLPHTGGCLCILDDRIRAVRGGDSLRAAASGGGCAQSGDEPRSADLGQNQPVSAALPQAGLCLQPLLSTSLFRGIKGHCTWSGQSSSLLCCLWCCQHLHAAIMAECCCHGVPAR